MSDDLRQLLHALADRVADGIVTPAPASAPTVATAGEVSRALLQSLTVLATGDLSPRVVAALEGTPEGARLSELLALVRALHQAAQDSLRSAGGGLDEVRAAAERAADTASRQRMSIDRVTEQLKQLSNHVDELSATATEMGEASDRASLLALNTGIEGLRVGGEVARTLGSLGEELRKLSQRTAAGARELTAGLRTIVEQSRGAVASLDDARNAARVSGEEASRAAAAADAARRADRALLAAVGRFHVMDEQTEALVAKLESHAEQLAGDVARARDRLTTLDEPARRAIEGALARVTEITKGNAGGDTP